ncbi:MAG: hypothetical protein A3F73_12625 [Gallionellales bacterium RIFCSPLOWO2_12_FULL_59_22]|nr:MAG: hypothetical protein A2Z65_07915 [Gallionellales bacterium RIFCSPLOWO2_02_58_13]OGT13669.1 MAG: hypothetical protein A3F73_12625 [Gallionellales bacterium RIFCSPLOWO2_12_FULL_59_22]
MVTLNKKRRFFVILLLVAATLIAGVGSYKYIKKHRPQWLAFMQAAPQPPAAIGFIDEFSESAANGTRTRVIGWALAKAGVDRVELILNGQHRIPLRIAVARSDVAQAYPGYPDSAQAGFEGIIDTSQWAANWHTMEVIVTDKKGRFSVIGHRTQPAVNAMDTWSDLLKTRGAKREDIFYFIMATSGIAHGGAKEIDTVFRPYESETVKVGMRIPVLYLRTTKGKAEDYAFDPDFPMTRKCGARTIADDNLHGVIEYAVAHRLPVLFTLDGGIWSDSACATPDWDITDVLEQDVGNCQWNEKNQVMPDDYLKNLAGSHESPELARSLTFNVFAAKNRHYKKRNLQQAAAIIRKFAAQHPDLFIGVTLDPDLYHNPFFSSTQWYDFNPGSLRQFREWLQGSGAYAGSANAGEPDLSRYRRKKPLTLAEVNAISGRSFKNWDEVDPPRSFPRLKLTDAWITEWEQFRRHLVDLHYDELSEWLGESGIDKDSIYSSQGFMAPASFASPFAIRINSPLKNYDTGGMSVEGAVPANGHLGAILYGESAANQIRMEGERSLFSVFRELDPGWAVVEHNTANLRNPSRLPDFVEAYRSLREIRNHGARFISPMAWNAGRGTLAGQPGFVAYTALRDSPLEDAIKAFMISHANLPRRSRLWTFGEGAHADGDGWVPSGKTQGQLTPGKFVLRSAPGSQGSLESPDDMAFRPAAYQAIIIKAAKPEALAAVGVEGQTPEGKWDSLLPLTDLAKLQRVGAGLLLPLAPGDTEYRRIRLNWKAADSEPLVLEHVAFYVR